MRRALILVALLAASPVGAALSWLPPVANSAALPASGNVLGDTRITLDDLSRWTWDGDSWELPPSSGGVTSVALAAPSLFSVSGSPVTTTGTLALALATQSANTVLAGPTTGSAVAPTFRALVAADVPSPLTSSTSGNAGTATALAADPADCSAGSAPVGINASGAAQSCTAYAAASHAHAAGDITSGQLGVANGGTGAASLTAYEPVCGGTTSTGAVQSCGTGQSNSGYVWTSNGASALPSWQAAAGGVSDPLTIGTVITTTSLQPQGGGPYPEDQVAIGSGANASATEDNYGAVAIGRNSTAGGNAGAVAIGNGATTTGAEGWGVCIGALASCDGGATGSVGIGKLATAYYDAVAVGGAATATDNGAIAIGQQTNANYAFSIGVGWNADTTEANQLVIGGPGPINNAYIGKGVTSASPPTNLTMHATDASGSDTAATSYRIAGGAATGNATGGAIVLMTSDAGASGSTLQTLSEKARIPTDGGVRIADPGTRPTCDSAHRGTIWYDAGGAGVADTFAVCGKSAADTYSWVAAATF